MKLTQKTGEGGPGAESPDRDWHQLLGQVAAFTALAIVLAVALLIMLPVG